MKEEGFFKKAALSAAVGAVPAAVFAVWSLAADGVFTAARVCRAVSDGTLLSAALLMLFGIFKGMQGLGLLFPVDTPDYSRKRRVGEKLKKQPGSFRPALPYMASAGAFFLISVVCASVYMGAR